MFRQCVSTETVSYCGGELSRKHCSTVITLQRRTVMSPQRWCQNQSAELIHTRQRQNCFDLQLQGTRVCVNSTCMLLCIPHNAVSQSRPNRGVFVNWGYGSKIIPCRLALIGSDRIVGSWLMAERTQDFPDPHYHQQQSRELHDFLLQQFVGLKCQL